MKRVTIEDHTNKDLEKSRREVLKYERSCGGVLLDSIAGIQYARSSELSLVHVIDQLIIPNGFSIIRNSTIDGIREEETSRFITDALYYKGYLSPRMPEISISSMRACLSDLSRIDTYVSIFLELDEPGVAYVGRIVNVRQNAFKMKTVSTTGRENKRTKDFEIKKCTRVDYRGEYERALFLVAGMT